MGCSIINRNIQLTLDTTRTSFNILLDKQGYDRPRLFGSALQRPELSHAELAALLRKQSKKRRSAKSQQTYWTSFMAQYVTQNANNNSA